MIRLFVAIELPEDVIDRLSALHRGIRGARWQSREQMHLTLRFIGEVDEVAAEEIRLALARVKFDSFEIELNGVGVFGKGRAARSLWTGVANPAEVIALHEKIDRVLDYVGISPETRKFKPHVTLARLKSPEVGRISEFLGLENGFRAGPFPVEEFHLYSSRLSHTGAQYRIEETYRPR